MRLLHSVAKKNHAVAEVSYLDMIRMKAGPVIQANGRLTFEDDLRSGGLLHTGI